MKNKPYLIIGKKTYTMEQLYCLLCDPDCKPGEVTDEMLHTVGFNKGPILCQDVGAGIIQATCECSCDEYPCVELQLQPREIADDPILLVRAEQRAVSFDGAWGNEDLADEKAPNVFLYGRGASYIAKMPVDTRPEAELGDQIIQADLLVSGDSDCIVRASAENQYVSFEGR